MATLQTPRKSTAFDPELRRLAPVVILGAVMTVLDTPACRIADHPAGAKVRAHAGYIVFYPVALAGCS